MSKLQERLPNVARTDIVPITRSVVADVIQNGRVETAALTQGIISRLADEKLGEDVILTEARKSIAQQFVSAWANQATIKFNRNQRVPVYQMSIGFRDSYFKVGSTYVLPEAMTVRDFEIMLERLGHRIENAEIDRSIVQDLYDRARPGLEAGQNLAEQFDAGVLGLIAAEDRSSNGAGGELEEGEDEAG